MIVVVFFILLAVWIVYKLDQENKYAKFRHDIKSRDEGRKVDVNFWIKMKKDFEDDFYGARTIVSDEILHDFLDRYGAAYQSYRDTWVRTQEHNSGRKPFTIPVYDQRTFRGMDDFWDDWEEEFEMYKVLWHEFKRAFENEDETIHKEYIPFLKENKNAFEEYKMAWINDAKCRHGWDNTYNYGTSTAYSWFEERWIAKIKQYNKEHGINNE